MNLKIIIPIIIAILLLSGLAMVIKNQPKADEIVPQLDDMDPTMDHSQHEMY